jgi:hypothetical protein
MQAKEKFNRGVGASSFNVFRPGETYTVFFLYVKPQTEQTYQIYVGKDFGDDALKPVRVNIANINFKMTPILSRPGWLTVDRSAVKTTGILTLKVSFDSVASDLKPSPVNGLCQPREFCKVEGDTCSGAVSQDDPRFLALRGDPRGVHYGQDESLAVCTEWAIKDLDCPKSGCFGFQFTLPSTFVADATEAAPSPHRPKPQPFPKIMTEFTRTWGAPDDESGGSCYYPELPVASNPETGQCLVP